MSILARRANERLAAAEPAPVGTWPQQVLASAPFLTHSETLQLAALDTVLGKSGMRRHQVSTAGEGKQHQVGKMMSEQDGILRFEAFGTASKLSFGTPAPDCLWISDWTLKCSFADGAQAATSVPQYRTWNDDLANKQLLVDVRTRMTQALANGPDVVVTDGLPQFAALMTTIRRDSTFSPLANDYGTAVAKDFHAVIDLAVQPREVTAALTALSYHRITDTPSASFAMSPDGATSGVLHIEPGAGGGTRLRFDPVTTPAIAAQRWQRRAVRLLFRLADQLGADSAAGQSLRAFAARVDPVEVPMEQWSALWTDQVPTPQWQVQPGWLSPAAVLITGDSLPNSMDLAMVAAGSATVRRRTWARGLTKRAQQNSRSYSSRRPALLVDSDHQPMPYVRYVAHSDTRSGTTGLTDDTPAMFWEVGYRRTTVEGRDAIVLLISGLGITDGLVAYGDELLSFLDAYCRLAAFNVRGVQFRTVCLRNRSA